MKSNHSRRHFLAASLSVLASPGIVCVAEAAKKKAETPADGLIAELGGKKAETNWFVLSFYERNSRSGITITDFAKCQGTRPAADAILKFMTAPFDRNSMVRRYEWRTFPPTPQGAKEAEAVYKAAIAARDRAIQKGKRDGLYK